MLDKPDIADERIIAWLKSEYGLRVGRLEFLPVGTGASTAMYRATAADDRQYFCKLAWGAFDATSVELTSFLGDQGVSEVIAPLVTSTGQVCASSAEFNLVVYPFVEGRNGYEVGLSEEQWSRFGAALRGVHTTALPPELARRIHKESYASHSRDRCRHYLARLVVEQPEDEVAAALAALVRSERERIVSLVEGAERLAPILANRDLDFVLCHSDLHPGNVFVDVERGRVFILDWDWATLAPKERDLMYIGAGHAFVGRSDPEQNALFYRGYGPSVIDPTAMAYYYYERNVIAIVLGCEHILSSQDNIKTRGQILEFLKYYFRPGGPIEVALRHG